MVTLAYIKYKSRDFEIRLSIETYVITSTSIYDNGWGIDNFFTELSWGSVCCFSMSDLENLTSFAYKIHTLTQN